MDATTVATAGVQAGDSDPIERAIARFTAAHKLFFVKRTLDELRATPAVDMSLVRHYERERLRLTRELDLLVETRA